ncbi:unnamed protein product [Nezara viridula]|uniref:Uncharacterized protein n=1 Tax=Nezara viridula TaxID=85310 RepID=A0A9P0HCJ8_NEZVI|nr:unnamed protein product [Nezara viridula]
METEQCHLQLRMDWVPVEVTLIARVRRIMPVRDTFELIDLEIVVEINVTKLQKELSLRSSTQPSCVRRWGGGTVVERSEFKPLT